VFVRTDDGFKAQAVELAFGGRVEITKGWNRRSSRRCRQLRSQIELGKPRLNHATLIRHSTRRFSCSNA
jgi:hypothetical protein